MQRNLSVWPDWPCRQRAKGSTLPKEILEAKPIGSYPLHKPEQLHFGYDPELNQSCSALIQQISPVAQSTRPLFTMAAQHTLQVSSSQGQHQNQSMPNKDFFFFFYHYLQVNVAGKEKSVKFSSRDHLACPSTLPDPLSFPIWLYLCRWWVLGPEGCWASVANRPHVLHHVSRQREQRCYQHQHGRKTRSGSNPGSSPAC